MRALEIEATRDRSDVMRPRIRLALRELGGWVMRLQQLDKGLT